MFLRTYGSPVLQAMVGVRGDRPRRAAALCATCLASAVPTRSKSRLERDIDQGGLVDAVLRAALYVGMAGGASTSASSRP